MQNLASNRCIENLPDTCNGLFVLEVNNVKNVPVIEMENLERVSTSIDIIASSVCGQIKRADGSLLHLHNDFII